MGIWLPGGHQPAEKIVLTPKQSVIYQHGWHPQYRFRNAVCGRRFGKTYLAAREMKRAAHLAAKWNIHTDEEIWFGSPTFKQAKRTFWPRLKRVIPRHWVETRREDECMIRMKTGHTLRCVGLDNYDDLRGSGLFFFVGDEWKDANPLCWSEVIQPMLTTSKGHALKIGCVRHDTLVLPRVGMTTIADFSVGSPEKTFDLINKDFWGIDRGFHEANGFWNNGTVATKRIVSKRGFELEAALTHPVLVMGSGGLPEWRKMPDLCVGDRVAVDRGMEVWGNVDPLAHWADHVSAWRKQFDGKRGRNPTTVNVSGMTEDLAYFMGLWIAEGSCEQGIGRVSITCGDNIGEFLTSGGVLGLPFITRRSDQWCINSYEFLEMMRFIGMPICKAPMKTIPRWVMHGRREWAMAFIAGMWDGDGHCAKHKTPRIGYTSASRKLTTGLQLLLSNIGVISSIRSEITQPTAKARVSSVGYKLAVQGPDVGRFRDSVRLRIPRKQDLLESYDVSEFSCRDGVPNQAELLRVVRNSLRRRCQGKKMPKNSFTAALDHGCDVSYHTLKGFLETHDEASHLPEWQSMQRNLEHGYYWDTIATIDDSECLTYDFTIPDTHSFWSNGYISHNTPGGFDHFYDDYNKGLPGARDSEGDIITDTKSWKYSTAEGGNVSPEEIERARRDKDPLTFQQEFFADFVTFSGRVIYAFDRAKHIRPCREIPINSTIHIGMDFNINPMSATCWYESEGISYQFDEIILKTSDTDAMAKEITKRYGRSVAGGKFKLDHITVYPDPAGAQRRTSAQGKTDISILKDHGLRVIALSSHPLVRDRINTTNARFENAAGDIRAYVDPKCVESIRAYERLTYREDTNEPDKNSGFDHPVDATGYYFFTRFGGSGIGKMRITGI